MVGGRAWEGRSSGGGGSSCPLPSHRRPFEDEEGRLAGRGKRRSKTAPPVPYRLFFFFYPLLVLFSRQGVRHAPSPPPPLPLPRCPCHCYCRRWVGVKTACGVWRTASWSSLLLLRYPPRPRRRSPPPPLPSLHRHGYPRRIRSRTRRNEKSATIEKKKTKKRQTRENPDAASYF